MRLICVVILFRLCMGSSALNAPVEEKLLSYGKPAPSSSTRSAPPQQLELESLDKARGRIQDVEYALGLSIRDDEDDLGFSGMSNSTGKNVCNVFHHGATADGKSYDTEAIQEAIDLCHSMGGGTVLFPSGKTFLTATVFLRSSVTLHLEAGAVLMGGTRLEDYPRQRERWYVVLAEDATHVAITGDGTIHGQAQAYVVERKVEKNIMLSWNTTGQCRGDECRPRLVGFLNCRHVVVRNVHLHDPAYWCLHLVRCDGVHVHGVSVYGDFNIPNNDGIDIDGSNNTRITECRIDTGDDGICAKSTAGPTYNLSAADSWVRSKSSAVKLGSGTEHDMRHLRFERIEIVDSHRGLGIQLRDQGDIDDVIFRDIRMSTQYYDPSWWGLGEPIYITACARDDATRVGSIGRVVFERITAHSENGAIVSACATSRMHALHMRNVSIAIDRWTDYVGGMRDYRPGCDGMIQAPYATAGFFLDNVKYVLLEDVSLQWGKNSRPDWGSSLDFTPQTVDHISFAGFVSSN